MDQFIAQILAQLDTKQAESELQALTKDRDIKLKVIVDTNGNIDFTKNLQKSFSGIQTIAQKNGNDAGKAYKTALQTQIESMAKTQRNAFSEPLNNMTKQEKSYTDWWEKALKTQEKRNKVFSQLDATNASNKTLTWLKNNSKAAKEYGDVLVDLANKQKLATNYDDLKNYTKQVNSITNEAKSLGLTGKSFINEFERGFKKIFEFSYTYGAIQKVEDAIVNSITELKDINSIITEISKTSDMTDSQLKELGSNSFDKASQFGKKASDYLYGVQEMNRSGFYGKKGTALSELSLLGQAAGDMSAEVSNSYLLATNAAYEYQGSVEKLTAVLDGQNMITNKNSVAMIDMAQATSKASSMAAQTGIQIDELSAIIGTAVSRTKQNGNEIGTSLKSLFVNLQDTSNKKIVETFNQLGISQTKFVNGATQLKTPIELLRELADAYNNLEDGSTLKADVLRNIGNKRQANVLAAILGGIGSGDYDKMLQEYSQGTGSAAKEAEKSANNWEGSINRLSNACTELISNFANSDSITTVINALASLTNGVDNLVGALGSISTIGGIAGAILGSKDAGKFYLLCGKCARFA